MTALLQLFHTSMPCLALHVLSVFSHLPGQLPCAPDAMQAPFQQPTVPSALIVRRAHIPMKRLGLVRLASQVLSPQPQERVAVLNVEQEPLLLRPLVPFAWIVPQECTHLEVPPCVFLVKRATSQLQLLQRAQHVYLAHSLTRSMPPVAYHAHWALGSHLQPPPVPPLVGNALSLH